MRLTHYPRIRHKAEEKHATTRQPNGIITNFGRTKSKRHMRIITLKRRALSLCAALLFAAAAMAQAGKAKYVFYFIGDGMGVNQVNGTETYLAAVEGRIGTSPLCFAQFPHVALATTFSATNGVTDSAAGGTALATGHKTKNGAIGVEADLSTRANSIAAEAKSQGKAVGIATSVSVDHATPASFYAHVADRNMYHQIGKDLVTAGFDFYAGSDFLQPRDGHEGKDLYAQCRDAGYTIARGYADYRRKARKAEKMILLQTEAASRKDHTSIPYAIDRKKGDLTLQDITRAAIRFLSQKGTDGFFLMVEGGKIDWACHSNDAAAAFREVADLDNAVKVAYEFYEQHPDETLIIITADHETGGIFLGTGAYELRTDLLKFQRQSAEAFSRMLAEQHQKEGAGFTWDFVRGQLQENFGFWTHIPLDDQETSQLKQAYEAFCEGVAKDHKTLYASENIVAATARKLMAQKAMVGWGSDGHSNGYVPVFAIGAGAETFDGRIDNTEIPEKIARAAGYGNE